MALQLRQLHQAAKADITQQVKFLLRMAKVIPTQLERQRRLLLEQLLVPAMTRHGGRMKSSPLEAGALRLP